MDQAIPIAKPKLFIEERGNGKFRRQVLDDFRAEEALADRCLRIGVYDEHA